MRAILAALALVLGLAAAPVVGQDLNPGAKLPTPKPRPPAARVEEKPLGSIRDIVHVYHGGRVIDHDMHLRTFGNDDLPAIMAASARDIGKLAKRDVTAETAKAKAALKAAALLSPVTAMAVDGMAMDAALAGNKALADSLGWRVEFLRNRVLALPLQKNLASKKITAQLKAVMLRNDWLQWSRVNVGRWINPERFRIPLTSADICLADCDREGVPLPPDWGRPGNWTRQSVGTLTEVPQSLLLLAAGNPVEVWALNDRGRGACIALPRWGVGKATVALGIICQSATTGKACFWDNRDHGSTRMFTPAEAASNSVRRDWVNGRNAGLIGGGKCVQCHRGGNVFLLHPGTTLALPAPAYQTNPAVRYQPLTTLGWTNPPATVVAAQPAGQQSCAGCHEIGNTSTEGGSYCAILPQAANREMPSQASPAEWGTSVPPDRATAAAWTSMMARLKTACGTSP